MDPRRMDPLDWDLNEEFPVDRVPDTDGVVLVRVRYASVVGLGVAVVVAGAISTRRPDSEAVTVWSPDPGDTQPTFADLPTDAAVLLVNLADPAGADVDPDAVRHFVLAAATHRVVVVSAPPDSADAVQRAAAADGCLLAVVDVDRDRETARISSGGAEAGRE